MRIPKKLRKVALFGGSCTGKTTIGAGLSSKLNYKIRYCGQELKDLAREHGYYDLDNVPLSIHEEVDRATKEFVSSSTTPCIVEGRFLNFVLFDSDDIIFIEVKCNDGERQDRLLSRFGNSTNLLISDIDCKDRAFTAETYKYALNSLPEAITVDTSSIGIDECVAIIIDTIMKQ